MPVLFFGDTDRDNTFYRHYCAFVNKGHWTGLITGRPLASPTGAPADTVTDRPPSVIIAEERESP